MDGFSFQVGFEHRHSLHISHLPFNFVFRTHIRCTYCTSLAKGKLLHKCVLFHTNSPLGAQDQYARFNNTGTAVSLDGRQVYHDPARHYLNQGKRKKKKKDKEKGKKNKSDDTNTKTGADDGDKANTADTATTTDTTTATETEANSSDKPAPAAEKAEGADKNDDDDSETDSEATGIEIILLTSFCEQAKVRAHFLQVMNLTVTIYTSAFP